MLICTEAWSFAVISWSARKSQSVIGLYSIDRFGRTGGSTLAGNIEIDEDTLNGNGQLSSILGCQVRTHLIVFHFDVGGLGLSSMDRLDEENVVVGIGMINCTVVCAYDILRQEVSQCSCLSTKIIHQSLSEKLV